MGEGDYLPMGVEGDSAEKLIDSAVAPLVAAARGYRTLMESGYDQAIKDRILPGRGTAQGLRISGAFGRGGDVMLMPWFTGEDLFKAELLHEMSHALGLGHVDDDQVMNTRLSEHRSTKFGAGDLRGLRAVGGTQPCVSDARRGGGQ